MSALASQPGPRVPLLPPDARQDGVAPVASSGAAAVPAAVPGSAAAGATSAVVSLQGRRLGRYELITRLGSGGMGDVYLAAMHGPNHFRKLSVVKQLRTNVAHSARAREAFAKEAYLAARLNHPNIVQTYETGEEGGIPFFSMEYLEGQTLRSFLAISREAELLPDFAVWVRIVADALAGLHHAHELRDFDGSPLGLIHRDVSPHNIFVTYEGRVCLIDFGAAKLTLRAGKAECRTLTGKLGYMAPEYITGGEIDPRADVFSMGVVLWEALAGRKMPNAGLAPSECCLARPRVSSVERRIDPHLDAIVAKALEVDPSRRFASAQAMREALESWLERRRGAPRQDDVGALMSAYFEEDKTKLEAAIRAQVATVPRVALIGLPSDASLDHLLEDEPREESGVRPTPVDGVEDAQAPFELRIKKNAPVEETVNYARQRERVGKRRRAAAWAGLLAAAALLGAAGASALALLR